jgi:hypothetical protein
MTGSAAHLAIISGARRRAFTALVRMPVRDRTVVRAEPGARPRCIGE